MAFGLCLLVFAIVTSFVWLAKAPTKAIYIICSIDMKRITFLFACFFWLFLIACEREEPLPKASQSGANIMAAKINGQKWEQSACWSCIGAGSGLESYFNPGNISGVKGEERKGNSDIVIRTFFMKSPGRELRG